jgi:hypothetical protein
MQIVLKWEGPFTFAVLISDPKKAFHCARLYLWKQEGPNRSEIIYVGKAENISRRQLDHYQKFISGGYEIPGEFRESGMLWDNQFPWKLQPEVVKQYFNETSVGQLAKEGCKFANHVKVFCAKMEDSTIRSEAEALLVYRLKPHRNAQSKRSLRGMDLRLKNEGVVDEINKDVPDDRRLRHEYSNTAE